jgi:RHS repeat-associated protein
VTDTYEYDAFGHTFATSCTTPNNYLYRGEQYDADLNLYYLRARYYKPVTGRFFSRDPADEKLIDPETLHRYLYAAGDPINRLDPRGREDFADYLMEVKRVLVARPTVAIGVAAAIGCLIPAVGYLVTGHDIFPDPEAERGDTAICVGVAIFAILQGVAALF